MTICLARSTKKSPRKKQNSGDNADKADGGRSDRLYAGSGNPCKNICIPDVDTLERTEIIRDMRLDVFDVLVGINLLRRFDIPEITLVAILDADKEGFLRSETSLIQTIGRAAEMPRACDHVCGYRDGFDAHGDRREQNAVGEIR